MDSHDDHEHSLAADLTAMLNLNSDRRQTLRWLLAGASALPVLGCGGGSGSSDSTTTTSTATTTTPTTGTTTTAGFFRDDRARACGWRGRGRSSRKKPAVLIPPMAPTATAAVWSMC